MLFEPLCAEVFEKQSLHPETVLCQSTLCLIKNKISKNLENMSKSGRKSMTPKRGPKVKWSWQVDDEDPGVVNLVDGQGALDEEVFIRLFHFSDMKTYFCSFWFGITVVCRNKTPSLVVQE